ncbi:hypothetical protein MMIC_P0787 [Mariprofundus micogutta]|uniref:DUF2846 domain-containing protein n=1 Tax=Mariprofundus micogutta TaxID=1921010 RepID=A0A1L8CLV7_9PROT|nr:hypothetical protein [Mariprofundus micogutta]GAV19829.1 hypothetical protein MMIC_P0787 [Mariprofundus micogutta]
MPGQQFLHAVSRWLMAALLFSTLTLAGCATQPKAPVVVDEIHGSVSFNIWRQYTLIEDDGKNVTQKSGPGNYGIEMIRVFRKGDSWMANPAALIWQLYENQWPQQTEVILPEGDYLFDIVMLSLNGFPLKAQAGEGLASFHVTAGKKLAAGDIVFDYIKRYRIYPGQKVATHFMRFISTPADAEVMLKSDPEKMYELSDG